MTTTRNDELEPAQQTHRNPLMLLGGIATIIALGIFLFGGSFSAGKETPPLGDTPPPQVSTTQIELPTGGGPLQVGDLPYEFTLTDLDGNTVQLSQFIGQPLLVNFWATWCGPCRIEMPELQAAFEEYQDDGLVILALNQDESAAAVEAFFFDEFGLTFTPVLDEGKLVAEQYGTFGSLPSSYFINPDGEITVIHRGPMVREQLETYLAQTIPSHG